MTDVFYSLRCVTGLIRADHFFFPSCESSVVFRDLFKVMQGAFWNQAAPWVNKLACT